MSVNVFIVVGAVTVFAFVFLLLTILSSRKVGAPNSPYEGKPILTDNEKEFYRRLREALPNHEVFTQVSFSALVKVRAGPDRREYALARAKISQKYMDFVICDRETLNVVAVVELDDRTHDNKADADALRDKILIESGYRVIRWHSKRKPTIAQIAAELKV